MRVSPMMQYGAIAAMTAVILWRGLVPAMTRVDTDFPNYYLAARLVLAGEPLGEFYQDLWFNARAVAMDLPGSTRFTPFPPATAFVMLPLAWLPPLTALQAWTTINVLLLALVILLLADVTRKPWHWNALLVLATGVGLINDFRDGQFYVVLLLLCVLGYRAIVRGGVIGGGIALGVGIAVKYVPVVYLWTAWEERRWKLIVTAVATVLVTAAVSALLWGPYPAPFAMIAEHTHGIIDGQSPYSPIFQSWMPLVRRLFVADPVLNPAPLFDAPMVLRLARVLAIGFALAVMIWTGFRTSLITTDRVPLRAAVIMILALALIPLGATYHFVVLALPVALLLALEGRWSRAQRLVVLLYCAIGCMPYGVFLPFDGRGWLTPLAYPRLWCMVAMLAAALRIVAQRTRFSVASPRRGAPAA